MTSATDALGHITRYHYDNRDNLIGLTDANENTHTFTFDRADRMLTEARPMGQTISYQYDAAGSLTERIDPAGHRAEYVYDAIGRRVEALHYHADDPATPDKTVTFDYDEQGRLVAYDDGYTSGEYSYDELGRKTGETVHYPGFSQSHQLVWHANGRQQSLTAPHGGTYSFSWDNADRLQAVLVPGEGTLQYTDYQWQQPGTIRFPGGSTRTQTFDGLQRHQSIQLTGPSGQTLMDYVYAWDETGNITQKATEHGTYNYGYDDIDRLTEADYPTFPAEEWTYDPLGNRLTDTGTGEAQWEYNKNNELLNSIDHHHEYDANGSLIAEHDPDGSLHRSFEYNAENRMSAARDRQGRLIAEYRYDPFGRRIQATVHNPPGTSEPETTWYVYSDQGLMAELDESGLQQDFYLFPPDGLWSTDPVLRKSGSTYYYYQTDHLGTPQQLIDQMGNVVHSREMRAFGETAQTGMDDRWRFPGQLASTETGLYYNYFRYYNAHTGRYWKQDPIGLYASYNMYAYVGQNPLLLVDPLGLMPENCSYNAPPPGCHFRKGGGRPMYEPTQNTRSFYQRSDFDVLCVPLIWNFRPRYRGRDADLPPETDPLVVCFERYTKTTFIEREYEVFYYGLIICDQDCEETKPVYGRRQTGCEWRHDSSRSERESCNYTVTIHGRSSCKSLF